MNRGLRILIIVLILIALGAGAYFLFFASSSSPGLEVGTGSPFGDLGGTNGTTDTGPGAGENVVGGDATGTGAGAETALPTQVTSRLARITIGPVAPGFAVLATTTKATGTTTPEIEVRYVEQGSGNIFSYLVRAHALTRLSNRTIPGIQEVSWLSDGSIAYLRFLSVSDSGQEAIETYALPLTKKDPYFLPRDLDSLAVRGLTSIFGLTTTTSGSSGTTMKTDGSGTKTVFSSALSSLVGRFAGASSLLVQTKASARASGYAFMVPLATGVFDRILGPLAGLATLPSPSGKKILYSYATSGGFALALFDVASRTATALPVATLADKCAWGLDDSDAYCAVPISPSVGTYPDDWYQGAAPFTDRLWRINVDSRVAEFVVNLKTESGIDFDADAITVSPKDDGLIFRNRLDGSLWAYDLNIVR